MRRGITFWVLSAAIALAFGCSQDEGGGSNPGADADTGGDTAPPDTGVTDTSSPPDDTSDRRPLDVDTSWDFGLSDAGDTSRPLKLKRVVPPSGPIEGGNRVRIVGEGLTDEVAVYFGSSKADFQLSSGSLVGEAPRASGPGKVTVKGIAEDGTTSAIPKGYEYVAGVQIDRVAPTRIPVDGGVQVTIEGRGFKKPTAVSFDGTSALRLQRINSKKLRAVAPPGSAGAADVRVTTPAESETLQDGVEYVRPLEVRSLTPAAGPTSGGTKVTIDVEGLGPSARVDFGGTPAQVLNVDRANGSIAVQSPAHSAGLVDVSVQSGGDATLEKDAFLYRDKQGATLAAIRPDFGPASGGTEVELVGQGFPSSNLTVAFGGTNATIVQSSATRIRAKTPAGSPGKVDVVARGPSGVLGTLKDGFEYREDVDVQNVKPSSGPVKGGTKVTITGSGFQKADRVEFGGLPASFTVQSDSKIQATTPRHGPGPVDVRVVRDEIEASLRDGFRYKTDLEVWGFHPVRGAIAGGTYVEVRGAGFTGRIQAAFDGKSARKVRRIDRNNLYLYTPSHPPGETTLKVQTSSQSDTAPYPYEFFDPTSRYGGASGGRVRGAVNVTVLSQGGGPIPGAFVMLSTRSDTPHTGITNKNGQVTLSGPGVKGPQTVTAAAKGFSSATVQSVDAENLTLLLRSLNPSSGGGGGGGSGGPPRATITGEVKAPFKLAKPDVRQTYDMAVVRTTKTSIEDRLPDPGEGSVVVGEGTYRINSRIGDLAVVAVCGAYNESTEQFDPKYIGVARYINASDDKTYNRDIVCDIPLDQSVQVKIQNPIFAPDGPDNNVARVYWNFGFEGVFEAPTVARGVGQLLSVPDQPKLDGKISDLTLTVEGGSFTGDESSPSSQTIKEGVSDLTQPVVLPPLVDVPEPKSPRAGGTLNDNEIRFQTSSPHYAEMYSIYLLNQKGRPFWRYMAPGDTNVVRLPNFPDLSYLPKKRRPDPYIQGKAFVLIFGVDSPGLRYEDFTYRDLSFSSWRGYSMTRWGFRIP